LRPPNLSTQSRKVSDNERKQATPRRGSKVSISLPPDILDGARAAAKADRRSVSSYFSVLVYRDLGAQVAQKEARP
jgi:hypothetical protein